MSMPGADTRNAQVNLTANVGDYSQQMNAAAGSTNQAASALDRLDSKLDDLSKKAGRKLFNLSRDDFAALAGATADAATFQKQLSTLNATAVITGTSFKGIKSGIESAFQAFPTARGQVIALAETISDLGITAPRDIGTLVATFIKLGAATGEGIQPLAQGLVQLSRLMGTTNAQQIGNYANSLLTVSKSSGVSATGVLSFAQSIAPMARQAGIGEAAVLGISAAFSKAGADGYVAANTFNSIVSDITNLTQSGSPDLAKYANLIGVTVQQFKGMDKTTALTDIFNTISKQGPAAINTLNRLGIDGTRAQSAIAAVVQSGGLQSAIATASASSGDQKNLTKGSAAAFNNLSDGLARLRNEFVEFGSMIGTTFLTPITKMVDAMAMAGSRLNDFLRPFAPIIAGLAGVAGGLAAVSGAALSVSAIIGAVGLAKLGINSGPVRAMREGMQVGRGGDDVMNATASQYAAHVAGTRSMPMRTRAPFQLGTYIGQTMPAPSEGGVGGSGPGGFAQLRRGMLRAPFSLATGLVHSSTKLSADEAVNDYQRSFYNRGPSTGFRSNVSDALSRNKQNTEEMSSFQALMAATRELAAAMVGAAVQVTKTGVAIVNPSNWGSKNSAGQGFVDAEGNLIPHAVGRGGRMMAAASGAASTAGRIGGAALGLGRSLVGSVGPLGLGIAAATVAPDIYGMINRSKNSGYQISGGENAISRYDAMLGTSSTALGSFTNAVNDATSAANKNSAAPATVGAAGQVSSGDIAKAQGNYKVTDTQFQSIARGNNSTAAASQYIGTLATQSGGLSPAKLQAIKEDLIAVFGADKAQQILSQYLQGSPSGGAQPTIDYGALGSNLNGQSNGRFRSNVGNVTSTIQSQQATAGSTAGNAQALQSLLQFGGAALAGTPSDKNVQSIQSQIAGILGGKAEDYNLSTPVQAGAFGGAAQATIVPTQASARTTILNAIKNSAAGKKYLTSLGLDPSKVSESDLNSLIQNNGRTGTQQNAYQTAVSGVGAGGSGIGSFALNNNTVQQGVSNPGNANAQAAGSMALYNQLSGAGQSFSQISQSLDDFKGAIKDTTDPLYQMANAAKAFAAQQQQFAQSGMSQEGKLTDVAGTYHQAQINAIVNPNDPDAQANLQTQQGNYQQALTAYNQYQQSMEAAAISFGTQMQRAAQDEDLSIAREKQSFYLSQTYAQQDFNRQNLLAVRDFGIQMARQAQTEAEQIYNPFQRIQAQYTIDAGTLVQNMADQTNRIQQQYGDLQTLSSLGVSQSSIDTLQLADPNNAQQTQALVQSLMANPQLVQQINSAVATRVSATTQLTQSTFSETFRNTTADFNRQLSDTATDYATAQQRAQQQQAITLNQMSADYHTMVTRAAQDLQTAFTQIYGDYSQTYGQTLGAINNSIGTYAPAIAKDLATEITAMNAQLKSLGLVGVTSGSYDNHPTTYQHATGGVSTFAHQADISEGNRPEAIIPLDQRGAAFMANFASQVAMAQVRQLSTSAFPMHPSGASAAGGSQSITMDNSMNIGTANITANDTKQIQAELLKAKRLKALVMPTASTAGAASN